jgi:uncharacterized circularly permuted ATP-grasp superfamily protein
MDQLNFDKYDTRGYFDEMFGQDQTIKSYYQIVKDHIQKIGINELLLLQKSTERVQLSLGMTFNVYSDKQGVEKILPLDIMPRIIPGQEWDYLDKGLKQRTYALNLFVDDLYHDQMILKDKIIPEYLIHTSTSFLSQCVGLNPAKRVWTNISGTDLINDHGQYKVLEDNVRTPSGVSYLLANREILKSTFPALFEALNVRPVSNYSHLLRDMLESLTDFSPATIAVLTPGIYNSAYFEHSFLAQQMGAELVEGRDLVVRDEKLYMITTNGLQKIDVLYRRVDDSFLDPLVFRPDSMLGVPGLFNAYLKGNVILVNAPGTGVADDKAIYAYIPQIIKYYTGEDPILPNVETFICANDSERSYVIENIDKLVVKQTDGSGGYGMLIGPKSTKEEINNFKEKIVDNPRNYIAQPTLNLSRVPTLTNSTLEGRHVDLRPYTLYGKEIKIIPGALTRVALKKGSLVVNSSQGGGSKDTWVVDI